MLPIQDAVPSGRVPVATIALIVINLMAYSAQWLSASAFPALLTPFEHQGAFHLVAAVWFLWLFGDNVEARLGPVMLVVLYLVSAATAIAVLSALARPDALGAAGAVSGVLGAYFVLLPRSRILVLVPTPLDLVETPALFFLGVWTLLNGVGFVSRPAPSLAPFLPLIAAFVAGACLCLLTRRPVRWTDRTAATTSP